MIISPSKKTTIRMMIGIHLKLFVTIVVELGTTRMDVPSQDRTQMSEGLAEGAAARPQIFGSPLFHKKEIKTKKIHKEERSETTVC